MEKKKRVLQVLYSGLGGHATVVFALTDASESKKHMDHHMLFYGIEEVRPSYIEKCKADGISCEGILKKPGLDVASFRAVVQHIKKHKPDVVLLHSVNLIWVVYLAGLFTPFKLIAIEHQANHLKTKKEWLFSRLCLLLAKRTVYLTESYLAEIRQSLPLFFRKDKVNVIPNGIDVELFKPNDFRQTGSRPFTIGMISRINALKDHKTLLQALAQVPDQEVRLLIAGEGPDLPALKELAIKLNIAHRVTFLGLLEGSEVIKFFQSLDGYVHATFGETMSTAIMQAMACGLPLIASGVTGVTNMVSDKTNGILVPAENPKALADAILFLKNSPETRHFIGENARKHAVEVYGNNVMFSRYRQLIES